LRGRSAEPEISAILPPMPDNILWHVRGQGPGAGQAPVRRIRAPHMKFETESCPALLISTEAGGEIPPTQPSLSFLTSRERRSTSIDHAHCRAENRIHLLTPGERHPAMVRSGPTSAYGLARGFFTRLSLGERGSNDAPYRELKNFTAHKHGRRLQDEDDEPLFTPGDAALPFGLLASATSRLPSAHALTSSGLPQRFSLLQRLRMRYQGSRTTAASYRHTSGAQAPPGRCAVAALHPSPSSPACGNLRHTWCFCCRVFVFKLRNFRMAKTRATAKGLHRPIATRWLLKVSTPRRGLKTRGTGYDG
jgi:hypothetical protein